ncbi:MAG: membrane protein insertase YidC [Hyphomonadaceae bacterium]
MQNLGGPGNQETRNVILAIALSVLIFVGFEMLYSGPQRERLLEQQRAQAAQQAETQTQTGASGQTAATPAPAAPVTREQAISATAGQRIAIVTDTVDGSIALTGARIDDLNLRGYRRTIDPASPEVMVLAPINAEFGQDAFFGWEQQAGETISVLADATSGWTAAQGATLTPATPVTLTLNTENGLVIERTIAIDQNYMFTITDVVRNPGDTPLQVRPLGVVRRQGLPEDYRFNGIVHQGLIGAFGPNQSLQQSGFRAAERHARDKARGRKGPDERIEELQGQGGWFGITDHYWLTAIVPDQNERVSTYFDARNEDNSTDYRTAYRGQWHDVPAGGSFTYQQRLFAGAKRYEVVRDYQRDLAIPRFDSAIDWGNFWFLTRPFFALLHMLSQFAGNFGLGILLTTIVVKLLLFPLVYQSFKAMAKMRALQPKMKEIQERYAADKQRQQQELLKLYQTEKINPVSGCIPILLQIPVFFALYKTLTVTIEMRHAPFYGWINDLSAPDPTSFVNLFGLLPFDVHAIPVIGSLLIIGAWPILYGVSMWALQALSPPPTDPTQAAIFRFLPILFTVMFAGFAAGLVIYWTWSNMLSILQQYVIMRRQGVETQLDKFLAKRLKPSAAE